MPASFGELLRDFRVAAGLSQEVLAERAQMSLNGVSVLERGLRRSPHRETIALLAEGLRLSSIDRALLEAAAIRPAQPRRRRHAELHEPAIDSLPTELTSFVGRAGEIAEIVELVNCRRLVTLVGSGGVGKTRTAFQAARQASSKVRPALWFVDLSQVREASTSVASAIAEAIGLEESPHREPLSLVTAHLEKKSALLILDNCECAIGDAGKVAREIMRSCANVRILATSRQPLKVEGEQTYRLPSLSEAEAIDLFIDRALAVDHRFALTDETAPIVAGICRRLDGIPLAIELAAARIGVLPPKALFEKLDRRFALLTGGAPDASPRQRTMRALIDWSYDLLSPHEQRIFEQLSVFAGGCTLDAATSVCSDADKAEPEILDTLASLIDKSLLVADLDGEEPRYSLLESMREYAREKLKLRGTSVECEHRHALTYYDLAVRIDESLDIGPFPTAFEVEMENWRAVLDWSLNSRGDVELGLRLAGALRPIWVRLAPVEGRNWTKTAFELVGETTPLATLAQLEYTDANIALRFSETNRALETGSRALAHFQQISDPRGIARAQRSVGYVMMVLGRIDEAEPLLRQAYEVARARGYRWLATFALESLGMAHSMKGERDEAQTCYTEAISVFREIGDYRAASIASGNLAEAKFREGDKAAALRLAEGSIESFGKHENSRAQTLSVASMAQTLSNVAAYLTSLASYDEARSRALEAIAVSRHWQQYVPLSWALQHLAAIDLLRPADGSHEHRAFEAARVVGFVNSQLAALGSPREFTEQQEYDRLLEVLRREIGSAELEGLMASGAAMSEEEAIDLAETL